MNYLDRLPSHVKHGNFGSKEVLSTPDGGFLYITMQSVAFIKAQGEEKPLIRVFYAKQPVMEIDIIPGWSDGEKLFATLTISNSILIWDFDKNTAISGHKAHCHSKIIEGRQRDGNSSGLARMSFMKNRNLLSISSSELVVYCIASNSTLVRSNFMRFKGYITALKCSPYDEHIFACGTSKGAVLVCDLQKSCTLYSFDGHESEVMSLSWNAVELSVPEKKLVKSAAVSSPPVTPSAGAGDDIFNIYNFDYLENEFGVPITDLSTNDNDEFPNEGGASELSADPNFNFTEACKNLKQDINALNDDKNDAESNACDAVTLADCLETKKLACTSSEGVSNESTEGSLELVDHNSLSDDSCHVDGNDITLTERDTHLKLDDQEPCAQEKSQQITEKANFDILLSSTSKNGKLYIRNTTTGSFCDQIKKVGKLGQCCRAVWVNSTELLTLTVDSFWRRQLSGKKLSNLDAVRSYKLESDVDASSKIVTIGEVVRYDQARESDLLWYTTINHKIICLNTKTLEVVLNYDTVPSSIITLCESPENTFKIAYSLPTCGLCIMNTIEDLKLNEIKFEYLPVHLAAAAKTLAWHANGYDIAYGTLKGQVGIINVDLRKHTTFDIACARPVYSLTWLNDIIFCVSNERVYAYKAGSRETLKFEGINNEFFSSITAYEQCLIAGNTRGHINIYKQKENTAAMIFILMQKLEIASHYITEIVFNPIEAEQFAVVANEANIYILQLNASTGTAKLLHKAFSGDARAMMHNVKWSNRQQNKLIASGFSGDLCIFDFNRAQSNQIVFTQQFQCPLFGAMFLPTDERYVICIGKVLTVEIIDTEQSCGEATRTQSHSLDRIKWATQSVVGTSTGGAGGGGTGNKRRRNKQQLNNTTLAAIENTEQQTAATISDDLIEKLAEIEISGTIKPGGKKVEAAEQQQQQKSSFFKNPPTALSLITKEQNKNALLKIHDFVTLSTFKEKRNAVLIARLFGQKIDAQKILAAELANFKSTGSSAPEIATLFLNQLNGGLKTQILGAIQTGQLKEWHVSLAPSISFSFWQKCSQAFAEQLIEQGHALQAAIYLLGLHKQYDAIEMLVTAKYFKEAMLIGRVYLAENDALLVSITDKWIEYLEREGNLHAAALICTVSEQYKRASEILSKQRVAGPEVEATIRMLQAHIR